MQNSIPPYRRKGGKTPAQVSLITIRRKQIAFNSHFIVSNRLREMTHVKIFPEQFRLGFQFYSEPPSPDDQCVLALTKDGGGSQGDNRCVQVNGLMRDCPWLAAIGNVEDPSGRKFSPDWNSFVSRWVIVLRPAFEYHVTSAGDIPREIHGIYRYKLLKEIVYIGTGHIALRCAAQERLAWEFDAIEYSVVPDKVQQEKWENEFIKKHEKQNGRRPLYNRNSGKGSSEDQ
jgi:hypothetical protein